MMKHVPKWHASLPVYCNFGNREYIIKGGRTFVIIAASDCSSMSNFRVFPTGIKICTAPTASWDGAGGRRGAGGRSRYIMRRRPCWRDLYEAAPPQLPSAARDPASVLNGYTKETLHDTGARSLDVGGTGKTPPPPFSC